MSWFEHTDVACPRCGEGFKAPTAQTVNVTRMPEARSWVLDGSFHRVTCPGCAEPIFVDRDFLYTDLGREQFVLVGPTPAIADWPAWEATTLEAFARSVEGAPPYVEDISRRFRVATVFGVRMLAEKVRLWDAGLDDGVVELMKLEAVARDPALRTEGALMVTVTEVATDDDRLECELWGLDGALATRMVGLSLERYRELAARRAELEARFAGLFYKPFVSYRRLASERIEEIG